jgi:hypothetical protein
MRPNPKRVAARYKLAASAYVEGGRDESGLGWDNGFIQHEDEPEDMTDGSLFPPVRDSYGRPQKAPRV